MSLDFAVALITATKSISIGVKRHIVLSQQCLDRWIDRVERLHSEVEA